MRPIILGVLILLLTNDPIAAQLEDQPLGGWYTYSWQASFQESPFAVQGVLQDRNGSVFGDMRQVLLQAGLSYQPVKAKVKYALGYYFLGSGEFGTASPISGQHIIYEDVTWKRAYFKRIYLSHRLRLEQRLAAQQNLRLRFRYRLSVQIPVNKPRISTGVVYLVLSDELFINGQPSSGNATTLGSFDRNRLAVGLGYCLNSKWRLQLCPMRQTTHTAQQDQLELMLSHKL